MLKITHLNNSKENISENDFSIASWVYIHGKKAGKYTDTLPSSEYTIYPLKGNSINPGVILVKLKNPHSGEKELFWDTFLSQISGKFESEFLRTLTRNALILNESDKLYKTLFSSLSHELRIPVATIMGASDALLAQSYPEETQKTLFSEISTASIRLNRLIENLLSMSRLESDLITPHLNWCDVHDLGNRVADNLKQELLKYNLSTVIPNDMPLVFIDYGLIEQALNNLVLNATQNSPEGTLIRLKFFYDDGNLIIQVMDRGTGFPASEVKSVFNKFYRGKDAKAGGTGLGLSIVKGFVEAHQGNVIAENRQNGGAKFTIKIPVKITEMKPD
jgi:two-component system, OmpR family, sensor histidine kinase KdpD